MLGDMLHHFCTTIIDNIEIDKKVVRLMFDKDDVVANELYSLICIQSAIYDISGHYDIHFFVDTGLIRSSVGILDKPTLDIIEHSVKHKPDGKINIIAIENLIKNNLLNIAYLDSDKITNTIDVLKAGILLLYPEIYQELKENDWTVARNLIKIHSKSENENY
jgi:hypothetical protein